MPFIKIYIHLVFSTKNRVPFFNTSAVRVKVWTTLNKMLRKKEFMWIWLMDFLIIAIA